MKNFYIFCAGLLVLAMGTFMIAGQMQNSQAQTQTETKTPKPDKFWTEAAQGGMAEVMLANLALQKSQNEQVKTYAQMMIDDHTKANDELKTLAASKGATLPTEVNSKQKATMDKLSALASDAFDREYVKTQVKDHQKMAKLFQSQSEKGTDADVKAFAAKTLPVVQGHLEQARTLNDAMKAGKNGGSSSKMNGNSNMNSGDGSNQNGSSNKNRNSNSGNSNMNMNSNGNMNGNSMMNSNMNSNMDMNSNMSMNMNR